MEKKKKKGEKRIKLDEGQLNDEQIRLLLKNLPVDITFVDENDRVCFYSANKDRIFARSPAIIGKSVQNCHPKKSVHIVDRIVKSFKEKKKDKAEFWIQQGDLFIYIRYFPVYDENGDYKGVVEVTQEVSGIRSLKGERRILDW
ncbi:MAG: PAS domain-containing protein [Acidobacteriota bacterium]